MIMARILIVTQLVVLVLAAAVAAWIWIGGRQCKHQEQQPQFVSHCDANI
jgi:hypothetical protein